MRDDDDDFDAVLCQSKAMKVLRTLMTHEDFPEQWAQQQLRLDDVLMQPVILARELPRSLVKSPAHNIHSFLARTTSA